MGQVDGTTVCPLFNLLATTEPVGDNQRVRRCFSYSRQEHELAHLHRHIIVVPFEAETSCHAATARVEYIDMGAHVSHDPFFLVHRGNRLVMTVTVHHHALCDTRRFELGHELSEELG